MDENAYELLGLEQGPAATEAEIRKVGVPACWRNGAGALQAALGRRQLCSSLPPPPPPLPPLQPNASISSPLCLPAHRPTASWRC